MKPLRNYANKDRIVGKMNFNSEGGNIAAILKKHTYINKIVSRNRFFFNTIKDLKEIVNKRKIQTIKFHKDQTGSIDKMILENILRGKLNLNQRKNTKNNINGFHDTPNSGKCFHSVSY